MIPSRRALVPTFVLALLFVARAHALQDGGAIREGDHFRIVCHFPDGEREAEVALAAAEAAWPHAAALYDARPEPEERYRVHLYRDREAFDEGCLRCEGRTWPNHDGLTSGSWGIALVHLGSGLPQEATDTIGLTDVDRELVAHEATHLIGVHQSPGYGAHPPWLTEGIAEWVASEVIECRAHDESRAAHLQYLLRSGRMPSIDELLLGELEGLDTYRRYALYGAFVGFLMNDEEGAALRSVLARTQTHHAPQEIREHFVGRLASTPSGLARRFADSLAELRPGWALGRGVLQQTNEGWLQIAPLDAPTAAWRMHPTAEVAVEGTLMVLGKTGDPSGGLEVRLARTVEERDVDGARVWAERYWSVAFLPGRGVTLERRQRANSGVEDVEALAESRVSLELAHPHDFEVELTGGVVRVKLDGVLALEHTLRSPLPANGQWGLAATSGAWGLWELEAPETAR